MFDALDELVLHDLLPLKLQCRVWNPWQRNCCRGRQVGFEIVADLLQGGVEYLNLCADVDDETQVECVRGDVDGAEGQGGKDLRTVGASVDARSVNRERVHYNDWKIAEDGIGTVETRFWRLV